MSSDGPDPVAANRSAAVARAASEFERRFAGPPRWVAAAPGRVNLIGEHTDYNDGFVLPIAIDRWAVVAADLAAGQATTLVAADLDDSFAFEGDPPREPSQTTPWANYLLGVMNEFRALEAPPPPVDLLLTSTVPIGAGLSSSAAIEVAMATALEQATGRTMHAIEKAQLCQRAEHAFAGTPCGIMDMLTSCCATAGHALLIDCRDLRFEPIPLPPGDQTAVLVVNTGVRHDLAGVPNRGTPRLGSPSGEYAERRASCESAAAKLGVPALRDATLAMLELEDLTSIERKRCSHVITENTRTLLAARALQQNDLETFGDLMFAGHDSLRELYAVSCPELDVIVDEARRLRSGGGAVLGARMTGGGFGGCAIVLCESRATEEVATRIGARFQESFGRVPSVEDVVASDGAASISPDVSGGLTPANR